MNEHDIMGKGRECLDGISASTKETRELFVDFCHANSLRILNTDFQNPSSKQAAFRENTTAAGSQIVLGREICTDVQSRADLYMRSGHYMVEVRIRIKLTAGMPIDCRIAQKFQSISSLMYLGGSNIMIWLAISSHLRRQ